MKQHIPFIDTLRGIATIMVIFIHVSSLFISSHDPDDGDTILFAYKVAYNLSSCAVALFVIISGALLLDKPQAITYTQVVRKYMPRILLALIVFGLPMCIIEQVMTNRCTSTTSILSQSLINFLTGNCWTHMWYLYMLLGLYLVTPPLHTYILHTTKKEHTQFAWVLAIMGILIPNICMITGMNMNSYMMLPSFIATYYLGFYINRYIPNDAKTSMLSFACLIVYIVYCFLAARVCNPIVGPEFMLSIAASAALFCIMRFKSIESRSIHKLSRHCFCIYIIHPVFLNVMFKGLHVENMLTLNPPANMAVIVTTSFLLSLLASYILHLIPFLNKKVL